MILLVGISHIMGRIMNRAKILYKILPAGMNRLSNSAMLETNNKISFSESFTWS